MRRSPEINLHHNVSRVSFHHPSVMKLLISTAIEPTQRRHQQDMWMEGIPWWHHRALLHLPVHIAQVHSVTAGRDWWELWSKTFGGHQVNEGWVRRTSKHTHLQPQVLVQGQEFRCLGSWWQTADNSFKRDNVMVKCVPFHSHLPHSIGLKEVGSVEHKLLRAKHFVAEMDKGYDSALPSFLLILHSYLCRPFL